MVHASVNFHYFTKCFTNQWHTLTPQGQGPNDHPKQEPEHLLLVLGMAVQHGKWGNFIPETLVFFEPFNVAIKDIFFVTFAIDPQDSNFDSFVGIVTIWHG